MAQREAGLSLTVDELRGFRLRGSYGFVGARRPGDGDYAALFRISVTTAEGREWRLHEDRVSRDDPRPVRPMVLEAPAELRGAGQIRLHVDLDGHVPPRPNAAWIDPELALPVEYAVRPAEEPFNVVVVTSDTTRSDVLGSYGGPARTPHLDRLAGDGVLFHEAHSAGYGTTPSHASLFSGSSPREHGVYDNQTILDRRIDTLAEVLLAAGYRTAAFVSARPVSRALGLDQGFLLYDDIWGRDPHGGLGRFADHERRAEVTVDRFSRWLEGAEEPFGVWLHFFDPHQPYAPPGGAPDEESEEIERLFEDEQGRPRYLRAAKVLAEPPEVDPQALERAAWRRYAAEVEYLDGQLGRVLEALRRRRLYDRSLVVFVTDHGENFLDRGAAVAYRHPGLHSDVTRLGLVVKLPDSRNAGQERDFLLLNSDLPCLIADVIGVERPAGWSCRSFLPLLARDGGDRSFRPHLVIEGAARQEIAIRTPDWLYREVNPDLRERDELLRSIAIDPAHPVQLYDLRRDPGEKENLAARPEHADDLERFHGLVVSISQDPPLESRQLESEEHLKGLKALGYLN